MHEGPVRDQHALTRVSAQRRTFAVYEALQAAFARTYNSAGDQRLWLFCWEQFVEHSVMKGAARHDCIRSGPPKRSTAVRHSPQ